MMMMMLFCSKGGKEENERMNVNREKMGGWMGNEKKRSASPSQDPEGTSLYFLAMSENTISSPGKITWGA